MYDCGTSGVNSYRDYSIWLMLFLASYHLLRTFRKKNSDGPAGRLRPEGRRHIVASEGSGTRGGTPRSEAEGGRSPWVDPEGAL